MRFYGLVAAVLTCIAFVQPVRAADKNDPANKPKNYAEAAEDCEKAIERRKHELANQYSTDVWMLKDKFQKAGDLEKALVADKEWSRSLARKPLVQKDLAETLPELANLQREYIERFANVAETVATEFLQDLKKESSDLAKAGKLADGRVLQQEIDTIKRLYLGGRDGKARGSDVAEGKADGDVVAACEEAIRQKRVALQAQYVGELEALEKSFQAKGALEDLFAAKAERERFMKTPTLAAENLVKNPDTLRELQQKYLELQQTVTTAVAEEFIARLEQQKQALTIEGKLDEAVQAKSDAEKIGKIYLPANAIGRGWQDITKTLEGGDKKDGLLVIRRLGERVASPKRYSPPIEIEYVCETSRDSIRIGYGCKAPLLEGAHFGSLILGWENNPQELRVDGGPARGRHVPNAGSIAAGRMVTIRQLVLPNEMRITVDDQRRASWNADFSEVNDVIEVICAFSEVSVKSIRVRKPN